MSDFFKQLLEMNSPYLIAEIGINHNGDLEIAKKLIDATNACGWHCAKFQKRAPQTQSYLTLCLIFETTWLLADIATIFETACMASGERSGAL
jgi:sialic acid synthase SpsE